MSFDLQAFVLSTLRQFWADLLWIFLLLFAGRAIMRKLIRRLTAFTPAGATSDEKRQKRAKTLRQVLLAVSNTVIYLIVLLMLLNMFGVNTTPFITGAGVLGLAIGFGSQALVKDFMSGLLVLYEGQYSVGDEVKIAGFEGVVKKITIRSTVLQGKDGERVYIANGSVSNVVNFSQKPKDQA